ncbi:GntR family transcriptional regulator [Maledivibacter halophilus]|uniref:GntR family transcriptional regulator, frlABCD operon transcriptional regulator n=1 Tax=Maledivibacter halophilus TaxID=36842 RepID=A0A1T5LKW6_9FIRM|nr:GntR family transcriptional regulator [Maledivibacter halophilus]SKC76239.1 GntR family transcriptional regulator, frlABCD operon transcriptional regulator [Maledivibacter halophilus]
MLESSSSIALYEQLKIIIKNNIINKVYKAGDKLPNETELGKIYGISRITVRRALKELAKEGLLEIKQGKGTFVKDSKLNLKIMDLRGFRDALSDAEHSVSTKILEKKIIKANDEITKDFKSPSGFRVLKLKRLIMDNNEPWGIDISYFPIDIYPNIYEKIIDNVSTFNIIKKEYGIVMCKAYKEFSVVIAGKEYSKLLNCSPTEPLFSVRKIIYDSQKKPIHLSQYYTLSSRVKYVISVENY